MIKIVEAVKEPLYIQLLGEQGYTYKSLYDYIIEKITDYNNYPGISLAYEDDSSRSDEVEDFVKRFIIDYVAPKIEELGHDYEYDYTDVFYDLLEENSSEIERLDNEFDDLVARQREEWDDEMNHLRRWYDSQRM